MGNLLCKGLPQEGGAIAPSWARSAPLRRASPSPPSPATRAWEFLLLLRFSSPSCTTRTPSPWNVPFPWDLISPLPACAGTLRGLKLDLVAHHSWTNREHSRSMLQASSRVFTGAEEGYSSCGQYLFITAVLHGDTEKRRRQVNVAWYKCTKKIS